VVTVSLDYSQSKWTIPLSNAIRFGTDKHPYFRCVTTTSGSTGGRGKKRASFQTATSGRVRGSSIEGVRCRAIINRTQAAKEDTGECFVTSSSVGMTAPGDRPIHKDKWQYSVVVEYEIGKPAAKAERASFPNGLVVLTANIAREMHAAVIDSINEAAASRVREPHHTRELGTRWDWGCDSHWF
jgi:hypothetical protein